MHKHIEGTGFTAPTGRELGNERRTVALAALIATAALAFATIVVATVVSVGIARADVADNVIDNEGSLFARRAGARPAVYRHGRADHSDAAGDRPRQATSRPTRPRTTAQSLDFAPEDYRNSSRCRTVDAASTEYAACDRSLH